MLLANILPFLNNVRRNSMSFSVNYNTEYANTSVADYLADWSAFFGDINHRPGYVETDVNTGGFYPGFLSGTQYAVSSTHHTPATVIAGGDLHYTLFSDPAHTFWGTIDSLQFGTNLIKGGGYTLESVEVRFEGLSSVLDEHKVPYLSSTQAEGHEGTVHQAMYGLMSGDATALTHVLDDILAHYGVSTANTFDEVAAALNAPQHAVADATPVGVTDVVDDYAIAA